MNRSFEVVPLRSCTEMVMPKGRLLISILQREMRKYYSKIYSD